jgi:hypothetical protein
VSAEKHATPELQVRRLDWRFQLLYSIAITKHKDIHLMEPDTIRIFASHLRASQYYYDSRIRGCRAFTLTALLLTIFAIASVTFHPTLRLAARLASISVAVAPHQHSALSQLVFIATLFAIAFLMFASFARSRLTIYQYPMPNLIDRYFEARNLPLGTTEFLARTVQLLVGVLFLAAGLEISLFHSVALATISLFIFIGIPVVIVCALGYGLLFRLLVARSHDPSLSIAARESLGAQLIDFVLYLDRIDSIASVCSHDRKYLVLLIEHIAQTFPLLVQPEKSRASRWAASEMRQASLNFLRFASWIYLPQEGTLDSLRRELIAYFNVIASGQLHDLPRRRVGLADGLSRREPQPKAWQRVMTYGLTALYLVAPIAALIAFTEGLHVHLSGALHVFIGPIYLIWIGVGLLSVLDRMPDDKRNSIVDLAKALFGKG